MRLIASLSTGEVEGIAKTLKNANERIERPEGLTVVVAKVVSVETAEAIVRQCLNLQSGHRQYRCEISELATAQSEQACQLLEAADADLELAEFDRVRLAYTHLATFAAIRSVWRTAKAIELSYDCDNLLQRTRVMTDVRPLFEDGGHAIDGAVVAHTLRLSYDSAGTDHEISLSLDGTDLRRLIEDCERALQKEKSAHEQLCRPANVLSLNAGETDTKTTDSEHRELGGNHHEL
jgi:hypothetical protein